MTIFASRLRRARQDAELSRSAIAKQLGVSTATVRNWETGDRLPRKVPLHEVAAAYQTDPDWLAEAFDRDPEPEAEPKPQPEPLNEFAGVAAKLGDKIAELQAENERLRVELETYRDLARSCVRALSILS